MQFNEYVSIYSFIAAGNFTLLFVLLAQLAKKTASCATSNNLTFPNRAELQLSAIWDHKMIVNLWYKNKLLFDWKMQVSSHGWNADTTNQ